MPKRATSQSGRPKRVKSLKVNQAEQAESVHQGSDGVQKLQEQMVALQEQINKLSHRNAKGMVAPPVSLPDVGQLQPPSA